MKHTITVKRDVFGEGGVLVAQETETIELDSVQDAGEVWDRWMANGAFGKAPES